MECRDGGQKWLSSLYPCFGVVMKLGFFHFFKNKSNLRVPFCQVRIHYLKSLSNIDSLASFGLDKQYRLEKRCFEQLMHSGTSELNCQSPFFQAVKNFFHLSLPAQTVQGQFIPAQCACLLISLQFWLFFEIKICKFGKINFKKAFFDLFSVKL